MTKFIQSPGFLLKNIAGDKILVARGSNALSFSATMIFNDSGTILWEALKDEKTVEELADELVKKYSIDYTIATKDVVKFIEKGLSNGILKKVI